VKRLLRIKLRDPCSPKYVSQGDVKEARATRTSQEAEGAVLGQAQRRAWWAPPSWTCLPEQAILALSMLSRRRGMDAIGEICGETVDGCYRIMVKEGARNIMSRCASVWYIYVRSNNIRSGSEHLRCSIMCSPRYGGVVWLD